MSRFLHWLGHVVFKMDCGVAIGNPLGFLYCKTCGRDVTPKPYKEPK